MAEYITELANDIAKCCPDLVENGCGNDNCVACLSFKLIGLGYTKQPNKADVVPKSEVEKLIAEAIQDFADKLKESFLDNPYVDYEVVRIYTDVLVKEMTESEDKV